MSLIVFVWFLVHSENRPVDDKKQDNKIVSETEEEKPKPEPEPVIEEKPEQPKPPEPGKEFTNSIGMEFVYIPPEIL